MLNKICRENQLNYALGCGPSRPARDQAAKLGVLAEREAARSSLGPGPDGMVRLASTLLERLCDRRFAVPIHGQRPQPRALVADLGEALPLRRLHLAPPLARAHLEVVVVRARDSTPCT